MASSTRSNSAITLCDGPSPRQATFAAKAGSNIYIPANASRRSVDSNLLSPSYSPGYSSPYLEKGRLDQPDPRQNAARRWCKRHRNALVALFYIFYVVLLLAPAIFTPTLIYLLIVDNAKKGKSNPFLTDGILVVLTTTCCVVNTCITLLMKSFDLFEASYVQNLLTGIGCVATLCAIRSSVQLPLLQLQIQQVPQ